MGEGNVGCVSSKAHPRADFRKHVLPHKLFVAKFLFAIKNFRMHARTFTRMSPGCVPKKKRNGSNVFNK